MHRDYKPANVLVDDQGHSKLADFGIAVRAGEEVGASGTPAYMAPEQWASGAVSAGTDVYAVTAVCFECLTGERPFPVKGHWALAAAHRSHPVPVERVPQPLRGLVAYGMAKNPDDRPRSAAVFLEDLEEVALAAYGPGWEERGRVRLAALAALLASLFPLAGGPPEAGTALALTRLGRRRLAMATGALVAAVVACGGGAAVLAGVHRSLGAHTSATSSPAPIAEPGTPPADSPSPSPSDSPSPETTAPTTSSPASTPVASPATTPPRPLITRRSPTVPATSVTGLTIDSFTLTGTVATAQVTVTVSGPGPVTVSAAFGEDTPTAQVAGAGDSDAQTVSGSGAHDLTFTHDYGERCPAARVTVTAPAGVQGCGATTTVVGVIHTNGGQGDVSYRWKRSDGQNSGVFTDSLSRGRRTIRVPLRWTVQGPGSLHAVATLEVISPTGPDGTASAAFDSRAGEKSTRGFAPDRLACNEP
jgi:eukaryotic-like serine/threonine-protein kinase